MLAAISLVLMTLTSSCTDPTSEPARITATSTAGVQGYSLPEERKYDERWLQTETLDLNTSDGTFIRAFVEAELLAFFAGSPEASYPGYAYAAQPAGSLTDFPRKPRPAYGTVYRRIVSIENLAGNTVRVVGCEMTPGLPPAPPATTEPEHAYQNSYALTYQRAGKLPPSEQRGPRAAPLESVFGDWRAIDFDPLYNRTDPTSTQMCYSSALDPDDTVKLGWPAVAQPRA